jgi:hypothetical protein
MNVGERKVTVVSRVEAALAVVTEQDDIADGDTTFAHHRDHRGRNRIARQPGDSLDEEGPTDEFRTADHRDLTASESRRGRAPDK